MKFHLSANVIGICMTWSLLAATVIAGKGKGQGPKSTKAPTPRKTPAPLPPPRRPKGAVAGLQPDCFKVDNKKFNICLELMTVNQTALYAPGVCTQFCNATYPVGGSCGTGVNPSILTGFYDVNWMTDAIEAKKKVEQFVVGDTLASFSPRTVFPGMRFTTINSTSFMVDDLLIRIYEGFPVLFRRPTLTSINTVERYLTPNATTYSAICSIMLFGDSCGQAGQYKSFIGTPTMTDFFFHEYLHCMGFSLDNPELVRRRYRAFDSSNRTVWRGPAATQVWRNIGCTGDIPMQGRGPHLEPNCFVNEILQPNSFEGENLLFSGISAGMMSDIGYQVNYKATEKFTLKNLGGCDCQDFCPAASATKNCVRRLDDPTRPSSRKRKLKSLRRRQLDPTTPQQPTATTQVPAEPQLPTSVSQLDPGTLSDLQYMLSFFRGDAAQANGEIHTVSIAPDGSLVEESFTKADLEAIAIAEAQARARASSNIIV